MFSSTQKMLLSHNRDVFIDIFDINRFLLQLEILLAKRGTHKLCPEFSEVFYNQSLRDHET